jgi:GST-like protein
MLDLYGTSSPNVIKIVIILEELGIPYQTHHIAAVRAAQFSPKFLAISPFSKVPVIIDRAAGNLAVFESGAILTYLAATHGDGALLPSTGAARYAVLQRLVAQVATVGPLLGQNTHFMLLPSEAGSYAATRYAEQARRIYRVLDDRLAASPYLAGAAYSIADIATYPWALYLPGHGLDWADYPALKTWCGKIAARSAVARATTTIGAMGSDEAAAMEDATTAEIDRFFWRETPGPTADFSAMAG